MTNSTRTRHRRTNAVPKPRMMKFSCGDLTNSKVASGKLIMGPEKGLVFKAAVKPAVSRTGEVSPMPRAVPRMTAVVRPDFAVGSTTCHTVPHWEVPSA